MDEWLPPRSGMTGSSAFLPPDEAAPPVGTPVPVPPGDTNDFDLILCSTTQGTLEVVGEGLAFRDAVESPEAHRESEAGPTGPSTAQLPLSSVPEGHGEEEDGSNATTLISILTHL